MFCSVPELSTGTCTWLRRNSIRNSLWSLKQQNARCGSVNFWLFFAFICIYAATLSDTLDLDFCPTTVRRNPRLAGSARLSASAKRPLSADLIREADSSFAHVGARREEFTVRAPDGELLHGWKVLPANPNGNWVLAFHGVADNRAGIVGQSEILLRAG